MQKAVRSWVRIEIYRPVAFFFLTAYFFSSFSISFRVFSFSSILSCTSVRSVITLSRISHNPLYRTMSLISVEFIFTLSSNKCMVVSKSAYLASSVWMLWFISSKDVSISVRTITMSSAKLNRLLFKRTVSVIIELHSGQRCFLSCWISASFVRSDLLTSEIRRVSS